MGVAYGGSEYVVNWGVVVVEDESRHVHDTFPFTRERDGRCKGEEEEGPYRRKHGGLVGCVVKERKRGRREGKKGGSVSLSSTDGIEHNCASSVSNTKAQPAAITGGGHHSYSPAKLNFRSTIRNGEV